MVGLLVVEHDIRTFQFPFAGQSEPLASRRLHRLAALVIHVGPVGAYVPRQVLLQILADFQRVFDVRIESVRHNLNAGRDDREPADADLPHVLVVARHYDGCSEVGRVHHLVLHPVIDGAMGVDAGAHAGAGMIGTRTDVGQEQADYLREVLVLVRLAEEELLFGLLVLALGGILLRDDVPTHLAAKLTLIPVAHLNQFTLGVRIQGVVVLDLLFDGLPDGGLVLVVPRLGRPGVRRDNQFLGEFVVPSVLCRHRPFVLVGDSGFLLVRRCVELPEQFMGLVRAPDQTVL